MVTNAAVKFARLQLICLGDFPEDGSAGVRHRVQACHQRVAEAISSGEIAADLTAAKLARVEVDVGAAVAQIVELRRERCAVAFRRVPLAAERPPDTRVREEDLVVRIVVIERRPEETPYHWAVNARRDGRPGMDVGG